LPGDSAPGDYQAAGDGFQLWAGSCGRQSPVRSKVQSEPCFRASVRVKFPVSRVLRIAFIQELPEADDSPFECIPFRSIRATLHLFRETAK